LLFACFLQWGKFLGGGKIFPAACRAAKNKFNAGIVFEQKKEHTAKFESQRLSNLILFFQLSRVEKQDLS